VLINTGELNFYGRHRIVRDQSMWAEWENKIVERARVSGSRVWKNTVEWKREWGSERNKSAAHNPLKTTNWLIALDDKKYGGAWMERGLQKEVRAVSGNFHCSCSTHIRNYSQCNGGAQLPAFIVTRMLCNVCTTLPSGYIDWIESNYVFWLHIESDWNEKFVSYHH